LNPCVWANLTEQLFKKHLIIQVLIFKPYYNYRENEGTPHKLVEVVSISYYEKFTKLN